MINIIFKRIGHAGFVAWAVGTLTFILMRLLPGDFAYRIAAGRYGYDYVNAEAAQSVRVELGLDQPAIVQYFDWLKDMLQFNLGTSLVSGNPVVDELTHQLGHSLKLALVATFISFLIAWPIGVYCGKKTKGLADQMSLFTSVTLRAQPIFVVGLILILVFSLHFGLFPVAGFGSSAYLILPAATLSLSLAAVSNRMIRNATSRVVSSGFYQFARLKGLNPKQVFTYHGQPNITLPVITLVSMQAVMLIEGIVMVESLFSWPGIGHGLAHAIFSRDVPVIQGAALVMGLIFVFINTCVDLLAYVLDPRQRGELRCE
ncbi:ABC transporter permease [uncultured Vibrio sp.]|uniref:ABC transporter permease n=1 Tax=uncultured Vibrio sp. TaxID=114054 RepID=UPI002635F19A|nr:ABC transporter permease [uncultured Vibrio sp.]